MQPAQVDRVLGETAGAEHPHRDRERLLRRDARRRPSRHEPPGTPRRSIIWWTATTRAASWRSRFAVSPPTRYSAKTARPSWVSSCAGEAAGEQVRSGWCDAVDVGDDVGADLVLEQRFGARRRRRERSGRRGGRRSTPSPRCSRRGARRETRCPARTARYRSSSAWASSTNASASSHGPGSGAARRHGVEDVLCLAATASGRPRRRLRCSALRNSR